MPINAKPQCDWAGDKTDLFKAGCRSQSTFVMFLRFVNPHQAGTSGLPSLIVDNSGVTRAEVDRLESQFLQRQYIYACRHHAPKLWQLFITMAQEMRSKGHQIKTQLADIEKFPDWKKRLEIAE